MNNFCTFQTVWCCADFASAHPHLQWPSKVLYTRMDAPHVNFSYCWSSIF